MTEEQRREEQPIAALITAVGSAGVNIVRISGSSAWEIAGHLIPPSPLPLTARAAGTFFHATVVHPRTRRKMDDAIVLLFRAPHSYTGEDTVEIQGHGGAVQARRLLAAAMQAGARLAEPGEFTRRAFLNGRMDLTQAEAVADLIRARTERAAEAAREQLDGALGQRVSALYERVMSVAGDVEALLDLDEGVIDDRFIAEHSSEVRSITYEIQELLQTWHEGRLLREGAQIVIAGRPNVGKSSLLNAMLGEDRAIVTPHAGTTRDTIEGMSTLDGIPLCLIDTAGIRATSCEIEQQGINRTQNALDRADLIIYIIDGSSRLSGEDLAILETLPPKKTILAINKQDLPQQLISAALPATWRDATVSISAHTGQGLLPLQRILAERLIGTGHADQAHEHAAISERHCHALQAATAALHETIREFEQGEAGLVFAAHALRQSAEKLGLITGRTYTDDLLDLIFKRFCVGK